ncbi:MAG: peptidoglycan-binding protein [Ignavibacteriales bacterium]|nr:peptidoglycan-binding protein [Ignavibacteriales bacterium]
MHPRRHIYFGLMLFIFIEFCFSQTWQSNLVKYNDGLRLQYTADSTGNRIPDFSFAGYKNGTVPIPYINVVDSVSPVSGDNTMNIQNAINRVAALPLDANGFRGALLLKAGKYNVSGTLLLNASGIVLRGVGEGSDSISNTIIYATGDSLTQPTVLVAGGGKSGSNSSAWSGSLTTNVNITTDTIFVGENSFQVANVSQFAVGDNIIIVHPKTMEWLRAVNFGDVPNDTGAASYWASVTIPILYNRFITGISGDTITIDAPVYNNLVRSLSQSYIYKTNRSGILTNIGIENLRVDIINPYNQLPTVNGDELHHAQDAIWLGKIEDAWVRHCTTLHFVQSGFKTSIATRVTIDSCTAIDPISIITGERRYNFNTYIASQLILFSNCYARYARHAFVSNGTTTVSGIVFYNCISEGSYNATEGHRLWSQGMLYDNFKDINTKVSLSNFVLGLYNRGNYGSGHGWAAVHSVAWNCNVGISQIIIQKPPTAQNYAIGCVGVVSGDGPFNHPEGYIEGSNVAGLEPLSLYKAQLYERMNPPQILKHEVNSGWNLISIPNDMPQENIQKIIQKAYSSPYSYEANLYKRCDSLKRGIGYWLKFNQNDELEFIGWINDKDTLELTEGWNLFGSVSTNIHVENIRTIPEDLIDSKIFAFHTNYQIADTLFPGEGYWIKMKSSGKLVLK